MNTLLGWNSSPSRLLDAQARSRGRQIGRGLGLIAAGHLLLVGLALTALAVAWAARAGRLPLPEQALTRPGGAVLAGLAAVGAVGLLGYALVLVGQWRCLLFAPQHLGTKDLMFACVLCALVGPALFVVAHFAGGAGNYEL